MDGVKWVGMTESLVQMEQDGVNLPGETFQSLWIAHRVKMVGAVIVVVAAAVYPEKLVFLMRHCSVESLNRFHRHDCCGSEKKTPQALL